MPRPLVLLTSLVVVVGTLSAAGPAGAEPRGPDVRCGAVVTTDVVLRADLVDCPSNGLVIAADHVTVDLNGHTVDGDGAPVEECPSGACDVGVLNDAGHVGVRIESGSVTDFDIGLLVVAGDDNRLRHLTVSDSTGPGVLAVDAERLDIRRSLITRNGVTSDSAGVALIDVAGSLITANRMSHNGDAGLFTRGSSRSRVADNAMTDNLNMGIVIDGNGNEVLRNAVRRNGDGIILFGDDNVVARNHVADASGCGAECGIGISLEGGRRNLISDNSVVRARRFGIRLDAFAAEAAETVVRRNVVRTAGADGIAVNPEDAGPVTGTLLVGNTASLAADDGIDVDSPDTVVRRNTANHNGDLGVEAVPGVTDGGGNRAAGNGNPAQCTQVRCG